MLPSHIQRLTPDCGSAKCPQVFRTDSGSLLVQGQLVSAELRAQLQPGPNEEVVELPPAVVEALVQSLRAR